MESSSLHIRIAGLCGCPSWRRSHPMGSSLSRQQQVGLPDGILWGLRRHHRCDRLKGLDVCYENLGDPSCILVTLCHIMSYHGRIMSYHVISWENHVISCHIMGESWTNGESSSISPWTQPLRRRGGLFRWLWSDDAELFGSMDPRLGEAPVVSSMDAATRDDVWVGFCARQDLG